MGNLDFEELSREQWREVVEQVRNRVEHRGMCCLVCGGDPVQYGEVGIHFLVEGGYIDLSTGEPRDTVDEVENALTICGECRNELVKQWITGDPDFDLEIVVAALTERGVLSMKEAGDLYSRIGEDEGP